MLDFSEQRILVTGGTRGIGAAIARRFAERGGTVVATYRGNHSAAEAFTQTLGELAQRVSVVQCDVSKYDDVERLFGELEGPIHVVVNNAGIRKDAILGMMPVQDWQNVLSTNLDGTFYVTKMAVMSMSRQRYGRIVNVVSPSARLGFEGQGNYAASKAGQIALAKSVSKEVAKRNITVNCVSPGFVETDLLKDLSDAQRETYTSMVPLKRFAAPEEIANAVLFLASKEASYVTGTVLEVAGGI